MNCAGKSAAAEIVEELGDWFHTGYQEVIASTGARYVEKMAFGVVNLFEIGIVGCTFDPLLGRKDRVIAGHDDDRAEFEALGKMHGPRRRGTRRDFDGLIQRPEFQASFRSRSFGPIQLGG